MTKIDTARKTLNEAAREICDRLAEIEDEPRVDWIELVTLETNLEAVETALATIAGI